MKKLQYQNQILVAVPHTKSNGTTTVTTTTAASKKTNQEKIGDRCYCIKSETVFLPSENETVCKRCGVVLQNVEPQEYNVEQTVPYEMLSRANLNLHQRKQVGGDPRDEAKIILSSKKIYTQKDSDQSLLVFSDICRKLNLNHYMSEDAWRMFCHNASHLTKAKRMCNAIYKTLQNNAVPYDEKNIQEIICNSLGVKNASDQKGIIFKSQKDKIDSMTPAFTNPETKRRFYTNSFVKQAQEMHKISDVSILKRNTDACLGDLLILFPRSDCKTLAKRATEMSVKRCLAN